MPDNFYNPRFEVKISGLTLSADITQHILSVSYENNLDLADMFTLTLQNANNQFLDSALFDLGKTVEIHMGYGDNLQPMMLGEVTSIAPSFPQGGPPTISITGYDKSYKMRHGQPDRNPYQYVTDSVIAAEIAAESLLIPVVDPSPIFHNKPLHQTVSDFAFLKERARANFFEVFVHWDRLYFRLPRPQFEAYVLEWGRNLNSFEPRLNIAGMAGLQVIRSYNEDLAQTIVAIAPVALLSIDNIIEKLGSSALELLTNLGRRVVRDQKITSPLDGLALAKALLQDILEGMYEGSGSCIGIPDLRAGQVVAIEGIGKKFSGKYRLKKVSHQIDDSGYQTSFEITQRGGTSLLPLLRRRLTEDPPPDRTEPVSGVVVGKVSDNKDLEGMGRVRLTFPWYSDAAQSGWARCTTFMSGSQHGGFFVPEIGDEVLVAFDHGDLQSPVVIGSLWNGVQRSPQMELDPTNQNKIRQIKTAAGHTIQFDDTAGQSQLMIKSAGGHTIKLDDGQGQILISDQGGSTVTMKQDGSVSISAKTNLNISATQTVTIKAANVNVQLTDPLGKMDVS